MKNGFKKEFLSALPYTLAAFLLGTAAVAPGLLPFGLALLCIIPDKKRLSVFTGVLAASFFDECFYIYTFSAVFVFTVLTLRRKNGGTSLFGKIILSLACSVLRCAYISVRGVNGIGGVIFLIASAASYPLFAFVFAGYFDKKKEFHKRRYVVSLLAFSLAFSLVFSRFYIGGISLSLFAATVFTLAFARRYGFALGGVCGIICGIFCGAAELGALGVMGMVYGLLATEIESVSLALSYMLAVTGYFYLNGIENTLAAMIIMLFGYALFLPLRKKIPLSPLPPSAEKRAFDRKISRYASAFSSLSSLFYTVSDNAKVQTVSELNENIVKAVNSFCDKCKGCELEKEEISNHFTTEIRRCGAAVYSRIPVHISSVCPNVCAMAKTVNNIGIKKENESEKGLKRMADEYSTFSAMLTDAAKKQEAEARQDKTAASEIKKELEKINIACDGVKVIGTRMRDITVYGVNPGEMQCSAEEIKGAISRAVGTRVAAPNLVLHDGYNLLKTHSVPKIRVEYAKLSEAKNGEKICGDTLSTFETDEKYFYCLISDGMGSGRDAALTSKLACIMLEKLLTVGAEKENAIKLLNKAVCEKDEEIFTTVDLLEIDRINGKATLIKAGAAPSFLIRDGKISLMESKTPPAGIMKNVIASTRGFDLKRGDTVVMMSDGVIQTGSDALPVLRGELPPIPNAYALAEMIMSESREYNYSSDDASVCVLRIK